jgi:hypothetical protein
MLLLNTKVSHLGLELLNYIDNPSKKGREERWVKSNRGIWSELLVLAGRLQFKTSHQPKQVAYSVIGISSLLI